LGQEGKGAEGHRKSGGAKKVEKKKTEWLWGGKKRIVKAQYRPRNRKQRLGAKKRGKKGPNRNGRRGNAKVPWKKIKNIVQRRGVGVKEDVHRETGLRQGRKQQGCPLVKTNKLENHNGGGQKTGSSAGWDQKEGLFIKSGKLECKLKGGREWGSKKTASKY